MAAQTESLESLFQSPTDQFIIQSSLKVLKQKYPLGLTIKELNEALIEAHHAEIQTVLKSSTILSTKLNAFYRKCQNLPDTSSDDDDSNNDDQSDSKPMPTRFKICPMIRQTAGDNSKRLVYKYCETFSDIPPEELQQALPSIPIMSPKSPLSPPHSDDSDVDESLVSRLTERLPHSDSSPSASTSPYHLRRVIKKTVHAFVPPAIKRRSSSSASAASKRPRTISNNGLTTIPSTPTKKTDFLSKGVNLYYDFAESPLGIVTSTSSSAAATTTSTTGTAATTTTTDGSTTLDKPSDVSSPIDTTSPIEQLNWFSNVDEFMAPEEISLDDLDSMF